MKHYHYRTLSYDLSVGYRPPPPSSSSLKPHPPFAFILWCPVGKLGPVTHLSMSGDTNCSFVFVVYGPAACSCPASAQNNTWPEGCWLSCPTQAPHTCHWNSRPLQNILNEGKGQIQYLGSLRGGIAAPHPGSIHHMSIPTTVQCFCLFFCGLITVAVNLWYALTDIEREWYYVVVSEWFLIPVSSTVNINQWVVNYQTNCQLFFND